MLRLLRVNYQLWFLTLFSYGRGLEPEVGENSRLAIFNRLPGKWLDNQSAAYFSNAISS